MSAADRVGACAKARMSIASGRGPGRSFQHTTVSMCTAQTRCVWLCAPIKVSGDASYRLIDRDSGCAGDGATRTSRAEQVPRSSQRCRGTERKQEHSHTQAAAAGQCTGGQESSLSSTMTPEVCIRGRGCGSSVVPMASCMHAWEWLETRETLSRRGASLSRRSVEGSLCPGGGRYLARHVKADESGP